MIRPLARVHDGLIENLELSARDRLGEFRLQQPGLAQMNLQARLEMDDAVAAVRLGAVKREIRVAQQGLDVGAVARRARQADADANRDDVAFDVEGLAHARDDALRQSAAVLSFAFRRENGEFVAAHPRDKIVGSRGRAQARGDPDQQRIAGRMAHGVVDGLELVEIDEQHGQGRLGSLQPARHFAKQQRSVGGAGERIVEREPLDLIVGELPRRDILVNGEPASIIQRSAGDEDDATVREPVQRLPRGRGSERRQARL